MSPSRVSRFLVDSHEPFPPWTSNPLSRLFHSDHESLVMFWEGRRSSGRWFNRILEEREELEE
jgi:hypothetical protein